MSEIKIFVSLDNLKNSNKAVVIGAVAHPNYRKDLNLIFFFFNARNT